VYVIFSTYPSTRPQHHNIIIAQYPLIFHTNSSHQHNITHSFYFPYFKNTKPQSFTTLSPHSSFIIHFLSSSSSCFISSFSVSLWYWIKICHDACQQFDMASRFHFPSIWRQQWFFFCDRNDDDDDDESAMIEGKKLLLKIISFFMR